MGGGGAWRERSRKDAAGWGDGEQDGGSENLNEEQREQREMQREDLEAERKRYGREKTEDMFEADEDVSLTVSVLPPTLQC